MTTKSAALYDWVVAGDTNTTIGKGGSVPATSTGNTVIGKGLSLAAMGDYNTVIGNSAVLSTSAGRCTIIGNGCSCLATSSSATTLLIGDGISTTTPAVCVLGAPGASTSICNYGAGHVWYAGPTVTFNSSALLTGAQVVAGGVIDFVISTSVDCTLPTAANIVAAMKDPVVGSTVIVKLRNSNEGTSNNVNVKANTGVDLKMKTSNYVESGPKDTSGGTTTDGGNMMYLFVCVTALSPAAVVVRGSYLTWTE